VTTATPSRSLVLGLTAQLILLGLLAVTPGLTTFGLVAGVIYGIVLIGLLAAGLERNRMRRLGAANAVTLGRAVLVGGVTAIVLTSFSMNINVTMLVVIAGVALALDGVDGQVARRTRTTTKLGARFDMEIDAFLILVLSVYAGDRFGWWTVALGAYRYLFVAASWVFPWLTAALPPRFSRKTVAAIQGVPWLTAALPPRFSRKTVAAIQGVVLALVTPDLLPHAAALGALVIALGTLTWSFGRDVLWLHRAQRVREAARTRWAAQPALVH
jgi:phosphatidylglycerophosphate synthase